MSSSLESFKENLQKLIPKFEADRDHYLSKVYPEAQARVDFITPLFKALGWDVEKKAGLPHHARDVVVERGVRSTEAEIREPFCQLYGTRHEDRKTITQSDSMPGVQV